MEIKWKFCGSFPARILFALVYESFNPSMSCLNLPLLELRLLGDQLHTNRDRSASGHYQAQQGGWSRMIRVSQEEGSLEGSYNQQVLLESCWDRARGQT